MSTKLTQTEDKSKIWKDCLLLTLVIGVLFAIMLGDRPFHDPDEGRYVEIPREMVETGDYITPRLNGIKYFEKPVLFYWMEAAAIKVFGLSEWSTRLVPMLMALLGCLMVYGFGRKFFDRRTGLASALILASTLLWYVYSRIVSLDLTLSVFVTACLFCFYLAAHARSRWRQEGYVVLMYSFAALAVLTKGLVGMAIPGCTAVIWIIYNRKWSLISPLLLSFGPLVFVAIALPWHYMASQANPEFFDFYIIHEHFTRYLDTVHRRTGPIVYFIPVILLGLFPWVVFFFQAMWQAMKDVRKDKQKHEILSFLLIWFFFCFVFFSVNKSKLIPYILPVFPALALIIGRHLAALWEQNDKAYRAAYMVYGAITALLAAGLIFAPFFFDANSAQKLWPYVIMGCIVLAASSVSVPYMAHKRGFRAAAPLMFVLSACFFLVINAGAYIGQRPSFGPIAKIINTELPEPTEVVMYHKYFQDFPPYLGRKVTVVEWKGELEFGIKQEAKTAEWMISNAEFHKRWNSDRLIYLAANENYFKSLRGNENFKYFPIAEVDGNVLVSNQKVSRKGLSK